MSRHRTNTPKPEPLPPIPEPIEREITSDLIANVIDTAAGAAPGQSLEERYKRSMIDLAEHLREGAPRGGGGEPPRSMLPGHPWLWRIIKAAAIGLFTAGLAYGGMRYAVSSNTKAIEDHSAKPMHDAAADEFREIKSTVESVQTDVGQIKTNQKKITDGIDELKKERIDELKEELRLERYKNRRRTDPD